jgi:DNA adenine methylase
LFDLKPSLAPLIKWSGGKGREIDFFREYYPKNFDLFIEPFVGGGAVFFDLNSENNVISDVHEGLINFYRQLKLGQAGEIYNRISSLGVDEQTYYYVRDSMPLNDAVDKAVRFYYLRKTAFRGMLRYNKAGKFNIPWGRYKTVSYVDLLNPDYFDLFRRTDIRLSSFENIFREFNSESNFIFLDPPYDSKFTDYGYCQFGEKYQRDLADIFKETKNKCLMVIGKTPLIEDLYRGYIVDSYYKKYGFRIHSGRIGNEINVDHVIIRNYDIDN